MFQRQRSGSVLCPSCGSLVGVNDAACLICGRHRPGLFGFAAMLKQTGDDMGFLALVVATCGALFIASVFASEGQLGGGGGVFNALAPHSLVLLRFGATGSWPVFDFGRFWTVLSAPWLHGGLLHIAMNMLAARTLIPIVAHLYGPARTILVYVSAGSFGALLTSVVARYLPLPDRLAGSHLSIGASGAIFGLIGALVYYGRRSGSRMIGEQARQWAIGGLIYGFMLPHVDNWGHLGGLLAGYLVGRWLDPLLPERGDHVLAAAVALACSAAAVVASLLVPLPDLR